MPSFIRLFLFFCPFLFSVPAFSSAYDTYLDLLKQHEKHLGPNGDSAKGEIEILTDVDLIQKAQAVQQKRLIERGWSDEKAQLATEVGIIAEDAFWYFLRDAVRFPSGVLGLYNRLVWKQQFADKHIGAIIVPYTAEGKIGLNVNYRHATRTWMLELPRGAQLLNESALQCAKRELLEETGWQAIQWDLLTILSPDSGVSSGHVSLYAARLQEMKQQNLDDSEAIEQNMLFLTLSEIEKSFREGGIWVNIRGQNQWVILQDASLGCALWLGKSLFNTKP